MRGRLRLPLALVLAAILGILVLATSATVFLVEWQLDRHLTLELSNRRVVNVIEQLERGIRNDLAPTTRLVDDLAAIISDRDLDLNDEGKIKGWLLTTLAGRPHLNTVSLTRPDLVNFRVSRTEEGQIIYVRTDISDNAPAKQRLAAMRARSETYWGELIYVPELHQPIINARRAVFKDGRLLAYVAVAVTAGQLSDLVSQVASSSDETPFVLYGDNRVLAHANLRAMFPHLTPANPLPALDAVGDPVLAHLTEGRPVSNYALAGRQGIDVEEVPIRGGAIVMTRVLQGFGDTPWTIGAWVPDAVVDRQMEPLKQGAVIGGAAVLVSVLLALLLGRLMAWPIKAATAGATAIATLETQDVKPLKPSPVRELDEQARAFNALLSTIRAFETYVPKSLVHALINMGGQIASRERDLTIMFTDVAGFTRMAERLPAARVASLLNRHFAMLDQHIEDEGGTIDKFMGDGLLAFWGAPERLKHRARRACRAALAIEATLQQENDRRRQEGVPPLRLRIGLHCGPTVVGNIGAPSRLNYTVVGDTVNVAQRLEALGKDLPGRREATIVVSEAIVNDAGSGFVFERLGSVTVRGRAKPVTAFSLLGRAPIEAAAPAASPAATETVSPPRGSD
ncbi:Adenylate cyclase, class 3 [Arboricoccus pini]|uniref:Adenylate cyclase, class 3 n=1 Tax=Arboricoccus pini TaxID=1963835 RepID=A0A212QVI2_9PROT|nr:adenylate/guanylate cyclase domain-containing protein [Arboricoccus pini]SNB63526.1 Adenylate cyclase, class 3 [Arboricoccus pini]